jgi:hypothetical protein
MRAPQSTVTPVRRTSFYLDRSAVTHATDMKCTILTVVLPLSPSTRRSQRSMLMVPWLQAIYIPTLCHLVDLRCDSFIDFLHFTSCSAS